MDRAAEQNQGRLSLANISLCPLCGSHQLRHMFEVRHVTGDPLHDCGLELGFDRATVVSCGGCGFLFKAHQPPGAYLNHHYAESGEGYLASLAEQHSEIREDFRTARKSLMNTFPTGGTILDVGCASGFFLESLGDTWTRFGVELFRFAAERARRRRGITVHEGDLFSAGFATHSFDVVCSFDVVEHLSDPMSIFREARRILKPGGLLVLGTGDSRSLAARLSGSRWTYFCIPEHLSFFNSASLRKGLCKAGFPRVSFERIHHGERGRAVTTAWIRAVGKHRAIELFGSGVIRWRLFRQKTSEFLVPYFFDHMLCVAS